MAKGNVEDLRTWEPSESTAKMVMDTKSLNTVAKEVPETVDAENENIEHVTTSPDFGKLGATGRE